MQDHHNVGRVVAPAVSLLRQEQSSSISAVPEFDFAGHGFEANGE